MTIDPTFDVDNVGITAITAGPLNPLQRVMLLVEGTPSMEDCTHAVSVTVTGYVPHTELGVDEWEDLDDDPHVGAALLRALSRCIPDAIERDVSNGLAAYEAAQPLRDDIARLEAEQEIASLEAVFELPAFDVAALYERPAADIVDLAPTNLVVGADDEAWWDDTTVAADWSAYVAQFDDDGEPF